MASKTYDEFAEWCEEESRNLGFSIKTAKAEVEDLSAVIEKATADIADFEAEIEDLSGKIATDEADLKAATAIRDKEYALFQNLEQDLLETIDVLERAVGIIQREMKSGASLVQFQKSGSLLDSLKALVGASAITTQDEARLSALLQEQSKQKEEEKKKKRREKKDRRRR